MGKRQHLANAKTTESVSTPAAPAATAHIDESRWHRQLIESVKRQTKANLDRAFGHTQPKVRLRFIHSEIAALEAAHSPLGQLKRYVHIVTALVHHQRYGGLKPSQVHQLLTLAEAILQTQGIKPRSSRLSYLYADLRLIFSQICRKSGRQWQAAWEQSYGDWLGRDRTVEEAGFTALGMANRALRLGHIRYATSSFVRAEELGLSLANQRLARLGRIKALRIAGALDQAEALVLVTQRDAKLSDDLTSDWNLEFAWEGYCLEAQRAAALKPLVKAVARGRPHFLATYFVEAFFWSQACSQTELWSGMPTIRYLTRDTAVKLQSQGLFYRIALQLERCYQTESPLSTRIQALGDLLAQTQKLLSIDKEVLVWAASARWLARCKSYALASLALHEYESLSLRLSVGQCRDVLNLMGDMLTRDWHTGRAASEHTDATTGDDERGPLDVLDESA